MNWLSKMIFVGIVALFSLFMIATFSFAGQNANGDHYQYVIINSTYDATADTHTPESVQIATCSYKIKWDRRVQEIELTRISTHTLYVNWNSSVPVSQLAYSSWAYTFDMSTTTPPTPYTETVPSDIMSIYISSCPGITPNIRIRGKGW